LLALIGDFKFEINDTDFDKIKSTMNFGFSANKRLCNFDGYQAVGLYEENIEINGTLIAKSQKQLGKFEDLAKQKTPVTFVTNESIQTVLILSLEKERTFFLQDGAFTKQAYKIVLQVVGDAK